MRHPELPIIILMVSCLVACDRIPAPTQATNETPEQKQLPATINAETILKQFIDASINRRHAEYYDLLSARDHAIKTRLQYLEEQGKLQPNLADEYFHDITYQITSITLNGSTAAAEVDYQFPDAERMIKQLYNLSVLDAGALPALDEMKKQMDATFRDKPLPMKNVKRHFNLVQENNDWRVYIGWDKS